MKGQKYFWVLLLMLGSGMAHGQEEGNADLFTESYTDQFQEAFFEALKQKGIENYDRSEALMLEAKKLDPDNPVVDFELARILNLAKAYRRATPYALRALQSDPSEYWYLDTFMNALKPQSMNHEAFASDLPLEEPALRLNLARWYISEGLYDKAKAQLSPLSGLEEARWMEEEISVLESIKEQPVTAGQHKGSGPSEDRRTVASLESRMEELITSENWKALEDESAEALELYPLQPYFYYSQGLAALRQGRPEEALELLKEGEGFILEPSANAQKIYRTLIEAYSALGTPEKGKKYEEKLKSGL
ncbi:tetratricopeptide repeat protein [Robiginitalea sp.]|uniref:tetratricopeptide repeat protein n=1 Tax=Robiginitalea sp. TaxID=1902411 RepID=UPI003C4191DE